jgi:hypothetical protein
MPPNRRKRFSVAQQEEFLQHLRQGMRRGACAELLGFTRLTIITYIEDHPEFERRVIDAEGEANEHVEEALYQAAVSGNVSAARAWMELRGDRRMDLPLAGPQTPPPEPRDDEEDELFPSNVTRMDPRTRRKGA